VPSIDAFTVLTAFPTLLTLLTGDPSVFTFSMHCGDQTFPAVVQQSDWDIAFPAATGDEEYLQVRLVCWAAAGTLCYARLHLKESYGIGLVEA